MNKGILTVGIILLSIIALLLVNILTNFSTGSELDYYLLKETADASMKDALDETYLTTCGLYRIDSERFVESFVYRFAKNVDSTREYDIKFYDINEVPPKASIKIDSLTVLSVKKDGKQEAADISTSYDVILETTKTTDLIVEEGLNDSKSSLCKPILQDAQAKVTNE